METKMGRLVCEKTIGGVDMLLVLTTANNLNVGLFVKTTPGVGKPYWYWDSIPAGKVVAADFTNAPIAGTDVNQNNADIQAIEARPEDVLVYDPPLGE